MDLNRVNSYMDRVRQSEQVTFPAPGGRYKVGVDLGTAYIVVVVLDEQDNPVACEKQAASVLQDGVVVDFTGAQRFGRQVSRELRRLSASLGRDPRIEELAQACHASPSDVVCALEAGYTPMSLDEPAQSTGRTLLDALAGGDSIDDQKLDIRLALMRLPIQQRNLIILRYVREHTQKETAKIMGVSQSQISRIERQALDALRKWLI